MKKFFNLLQWAVAIALIIFVARNLGRPVPPPHYRPESWASWDGFYCLSYAGVTREKGDGYVTPRQLGQHLRMLRDDGYESIRPEDARAYLEGRSPLPAKAVLLLFEGGRKDSFLAATPLLRQFGQLATMCIPTSVTRKWGSFYLHDNDLQKFLKDAHWNLASMGHEAILDVPTGPGQQGHFLTQRLWQNGQPEDDRAFRSRLASDFAAAAQILERVGHTNISAYLFPFADDGTAAGADPLAAEIIERSVSAHHRLAFSRADDAFNGPDSDPFQLSRLRVRGDWTDDDLRRQLTKARPRTEALTQVGGPDAWSIEGHGLLTPVRLHLQADSTAWLEGSSAWVNMDVRVRLHRQAGGTAILYVRYAGPSRTLRVTLSDEDVQLQERIGPTMQTLAAFPAGAARTNDYDLTVRVRGNRVWLLNEGRLLAGPVPVTRQTSHGRVGLESIGGALDLTDFSATPHASLWVQAGSYRGLPEPVRDQVDTLLTPWFSTDRDPAVSEQQRSDLLAAASRGVEVIPLITVQSALTAEQAEALAGVIAGSLDHLITKALVQRLALRGPSDLLADALRERGYRLLRTIDRQQAAELAARGRDALAFDTWLLQDGDGAATDALLRLLPASRIALLTEDAHAAPPGVRTIRQFP